MNFSISFKLISTKLITDDNIGLLILSSIPFMVDNQIRIRSVPTLITYNIISKKVISINSIQTELPENYRNKLLGFTFQNENLIMHVYPNDPIVNPKYYLAKFNKINDKYVFNVFLNYYPSEIYFQSGLNASFNTLKYFNNIIAEDRSNRILDLNNGNYYYFDIGLNNQQSVFDFSKQVKTDLGKVNIFKTYWVQDLCIQENNIVVLYNDCSGNKVIVYIDMNNKSERYRVTISHEILSRNNFVVQKLENTAKKLIVLDIKLNTLKSVTIESLQY